MIEFKASMLQQHWIYIPFMWEKSIHISFAKEQTFVILSLKGYVVEFIAVIAWKRAFICNAFPAFGIEIGVESARGWGTAV